MLRQFLGATRAHSVSYATEEQRRNWPGSGLPQRRNDAYSQNIFLPNQGRALSGYACALLGLHAYGHARLASLWLAPISRGADVCHELLTLLVLLCHKYRTLIPQQGHRGKQRIILRAIQYRSDAIESGTCRCVRPAAARRVIVG